MKGHMGKILKLDLTNKEAIEIPTSKYEEYVGGFGMGIAAFWDEIDKDYLASAEDSTGWEPENVVCMFPGPLQGTIAPNGGRTEVCGIGPEANPRPQFTRSNFGGRWGAMLKFAGWDGVIVTGKSEAPVWVDIRDDKVEFQDAAGLWGLGTFATQEEIWREVGSDNHNWYQPGSNSRDSGRTVSSPAVVTTGPAGENLVRLACLIHDSANASGQGGFGGVFGSKNLKAISVIGTGAVEVADPQDLLAAREWLSQYTYDCDEAATRSPHEVFLGIGQHQDTNPYGVPETAGRQLGCTACQRCCKINVKNSRYPGGESMCVEKGFYTAEDAAKHGKSTEVGYIASQLLNDYALNAYALGTEITGWIISLGKRDLWGPGKPADTTIDINDIGSLDFVEKYLHAIAYREPGMGNDLAEGAPRAAAKWGVLEEDLLSGALDQPYWIGTKHHGDEIGWLYQSLFTSRDINQHDLTFQMMVKHYLPAAQVTAITGLDAAFVAERAAELASPWNDPLTVDCSEDSVYSISMARRIAFQRRYCNFWKNSALYCDWFSPSAHSLVTEDGRGVSPELEERFFKAVTGVEMSWDDGLELGRKLTTFERAIHVMQGRHRDEEYFPPYPPYNSWIHTEEPPYAQVVAYSVYDKDTDTWSWGEPRFPIRKPQFDEFKSLYFELEGWDPSTGWPTKATLEELGLGHVAEVLAAKDKLPS